MRELIEAQRAEIAELRRRLSTVEVVRHPEWRVVLAVCAWDALEDATESAIFTCYHDLRDAGIIGGRVKSTACYQPQVRNELRDMAYESCPDFTHVLFVDADMLGFTGKSVCTMLEKDLPIVSGWYCRRHPPHRPVHSNFPTDDRKGGVESPRAVELQRFRAGGAHEVYGAGGGFLLVKREVLDALGPGPFRFLPSNPEVMELAQAVVADAPEAKGLAQRILDWLADPGGAWFIGEDYAFSVRAREKGFKTHVDFDVPVGHLRPDVADVETYFTCPDAGDRSLEPAPAEAVPGG